MFASRTCCARARVDHSCCIATVPLLRARAQFLRQLQTSALCATTRASAATANKSRVGGSARSPHKVWSSVADGSGLWLSLLQRARAEQARQVAAHSRVARATPRREASRPPQASRAAQYCTRGPMRYSPQHAQRPYCAKAHSTRSIHASPSPLEPRPASACGWHRCRVLEVP
jgi:hypothetical protein